MPGTNISKEGESRSRTNEYTIYYSSERIKQDFQKAYVRINFDDAEAIKKEIRSLKSDPCQAGKKRKAIKLRESLCLANHRLKVGKYRVFYDLDHLQHRVVLLFLGRR